jgi:hypothetical protein
MGDLVLKGATSGQITLTPTGVAGTNTLTLPAVTGNIITSADSGTVTQTMLGTGVAGNGPAFSVYMSNGGSNFSVTSAANTLVPFDTKNFDTGTCFNNTSSSTTLNGVTAPARAFAPNVAGYYQINLGLLGVAASGLTLVQAILFKNTTPTTTAYGSYSGNSGTSFCSELVYLNGTSDYVLANINVIGTSTAILSSTLTEMSGALVRAA